jgi:hypothetical protein
MSLIQRLNDREDLEKSRRLAISPKKIPPAVFILLEKACPGFSSKGMSWVEPSAKLYAARFQVRL